MEIAITTMSSKGQVVIPSELRENIEEGEKLIIIKNDHQLILKKVTELDKYLKEDLEFAKRTEQALKRYVKGKFKTMNFDEFIAEMKKKGNTKQGGASHSAFKGSTNTPKCSHL